MNDLLAIAADILTVLGSALALTLEIRRGRRQATGQDDEQGSER